MLYEVITSLPPQHWDMVLSSQLYIPSRSVLVPVLVITSYSIHYTKLYDQDGKVTVMKDKIALQAGEVLDATFMSVKALRKFLEEQIEEAKKQGILWSLHMKATMMKVSDPKIFGHAVTVYYKDVFEKHAETFKKLRNNFV